MGWMAGMVGGHVPALIVVCAIFIAASIYSG